MCGIFGFTGPENKELLRKMSFSINHRGPDQNGLYSDGYINLGSDRLSIIDLRKGKQPIYNENRTVFVILNGEIYNFLELKESLKNKHVFYTNTDTEVIVHLYEDYGEDFIYKMRGMFALALWDSNKKKLLLARDRLGQKPLYYTIKNHQILFSSEIKAILEDESVKREVNLKSLSYYLSLLYTPFNETMFEGISKVLPGEMIIFENKRVKLRKYWSPIFNISDHNESYYLGRLNKLLKEAVRYRLISDVPIGAYLSGGLDSSTIVALMSGLSTKVNTFSVGFEDEGDELEYAKLISEKFGTNHKEVLIKPNLINFLPKMVWHLDEPMADPGIVPVFFMSEHAKKDFKVVLTGDGGDEIFGGYPPYKTLSIVEKSKKFFPKILSSPVKSLAKRLPPDKRFTRYLSYISSKNKAEMYFNYMSNFNEMEKKDLMKKSSKKNSVDIYKTFFKKNLDFVSQMQLCDINTILPEDFNMKIDKMTSANSIEARSPFLDHKLVELMLTTPPHMRVRGNITKYLLRKSVKDILPKSIIEREKHGFNVPIHKWFKNELKDYAVNTFLENPDIIDTYFKKEYISNLFEKLAREKYKYSYQVWSILVFILWYKSFMASQF